MKKKLGLKKVLSLSDRRIIFYEMPNQTQIFGIWEKSNEEWTHSHFAFEINLTNLKNGITWLHSRGIEAVESFGLKPFEPIVHTWVPMASIYFKDPDGNSLEFATRLQESADKKPDVIYLSEWEFNNIKNRREGDIT